MNKFKGLIGSLLVLLAVVGFLSILTQLPSYSAEDPGGYCNSGSLKYCWISGNNWNCQFVGGPRCVDQPQ